LYREDALNMVGIIDRLKGRKPSDAANGTAPTAADITAAIERLRSERYDAATKIDSGAQKRARLLLEEKYDAVVAHDAEMAALALRVKALEDAEPVLAAELRQIRERDRLALLDGEKAIVRAAVDKFDAALAAAVHANLDLDAAYKNACSRLGIEIARIHLPPPVYGAMVNSEGHRLWRNVVLPAYRPAAAQPPALKPAAAPAPKPRPVLGAPVVRPDGNVDVIIIDRDGLNIPQTHEDYPPGTRVAMAPGWAKVLVDADRARYPIASDGAKPAVLVGSRSAPPVRAPRPAPTEAVSPGRTRVRVIRAGYPDSNGRGCNTGDLIDIDTQTAVIACGNGVIEIVEHGPRDLADDAPDDEILLPQ
jgi:hypothetical protein